jgi:hypothetical protein
MGKNTTIVSFKGSVSVLQVYSNVLVGLLVLMLFMALLLTCWFYCVVLKKEINGEERKEINGEERRRRGEEERVGGN